MANKYRSRTAAQLSAHLEKWYLCLDAIAAGQSYSLTSGGITRAMTKANLTEVNTMIENLENSLDHKQGNSITHTNIKITKS
jgi:hypothetical protein